MDLASMFKDDGDALLASWLHAARRIKPVLFAGAGLSFGAIPQEGWTNRVHPSQRAKEPRCLGWSQLVALLKKELRNPDAEETDPLRLAQYFEVMHGRHRLHGVLQDAVPDHFLAPGRAHTAAAQVDWSAIVTTNYDTLIQRAYDTALVGSPHVIVHDSDVAMPRLPGRSFDLIHMHGCLNSPESIVLTAEDYRSYAERHPLILTRLRQLFAQHPVLIVGFSLDDPNFYALNGLMFDLLRHTRPPVLSIQFSPQGRARLHFWNSVGLQIATLINHDLLTTLFEYISRDLQPKDPREELLGDAFLRHHHIADSIDASADLRVQLLSLRALLEQLPTGHQMDNVAQEAWAHVGTSYFKSIKRSLPTTQENSAEPYEGGMDGDKTPLDGSARDQVSAIFKAMPCEHGVEWVGLGLRYVGPYARIGHRPCNLVSLLELPEAARHISTEHRAFILLTRYRAALDTNDLETAQRLEQEIQALLFAPALEELRRLKLLLAHRLGTSGGSMDLAGAILSPQVMNVRAAIQYEQGAVDVARGLYEQAREAARRRADTTSEWVSLEGLRRILSLGNEPPDDASKTKKREIATRINQLDKVAEVQFLQRRIDSAREWTLDKLEAQQASLLEANEQLSRRSPGLVFMSFDKAWTALEVQQHLGLTGDFVGRLAEPFGKLLALSSPSDLLIEALQILTQCGSRAPEKLLQMAALESEITRQTDAIAQELTSPSPHIGVRLSKAGALRPLAHFAHTQHVELIRKHLRDSLDVVLSAKAHTYYVVGPAVTRTWKTSDVDTLVRALATLAYADATGPRQIAALFAHADATVRRAAIRAAGASPWEAWLAAGFIGDPELAILHGVASRNPDEILDRDWQGWISICLATLSDSSLCSTSVDDSAEAWLKRLLPSTAERSPSRADGIAAAAQSLILRRPTVLDSSIQALAADIAAHKRGPLPVISIATRLHQKFDDSFHATLISRFSSADSLGFPLEQDDETLAYLATVAVFRDSPAALDAKRIVLSAIERDPLAAMSIPSTALSSPEFAALSHQAISTLLSGRRPILRGDESNNWEATVYQGLVAASRFVDATRRLPDSWKEGAVVHLASRSTQLARMSTALLSLAALNESHNPTPHLIPCLLHSLRKPEVRARAAASYWLGRLSAADRADRSRDGILLLMDEEPSSWVKTHFALGEAEEALRLRNSASSQ